MYHKIIEKLKGKKIAIVGFGREGKSTYNFIRKYLKEQKLSILDKNINLTNNNEYLLEDKNVNLVLGEHYLEKLDIYDLIIKSPGISFNNIDITNIKDKITSECNLLLEQTNAFVIGVTGTKGKSTTSSLIYKIIKDQNKDVYLCGNIGTPIFDYIDLIGHNSILVVEMSAYHTEFIRKSPNIGIILNLFEEHLDYFKSKEKYFLSKLNMFKYQNSDDYGIYSADNKTLKELVEKEDYKGNLVRVLSINKSENIVNNTVFCDEKYIYIKSNDKIKKIYDINSKRHLLGRHNLENIMFVLAVANILKLDLKKVIKSINEFTPLEHRMEKVGVFKGITFYNDSIATIPEATINCIESLKLVDTLILGGMDRGIDYSGLVSYLEKSDIRNLICLPETGHKIGKYLDKTKNVIYVEEMKNAVEEAYKVTEKGKICLLSPAASSYNRYKSFEEKGKDYKKNVESFEPRNS